MTKWILKNSNAHRFTRARCAPLPLSLPLPRPRPLPLPPCGEPSENREAVYICKLQATMTRTLPVKQTSTTLTAEKVGTTHTCQHTSREKPRAVLHS